MKMKKLAVLMLAGTLSLGALTACSDEEAVEEETTQEETDVEEDAEEDVEEEEVDEEEVDEEEVDEEDADVEEDVEEEEEYEEEEVDEEATAEVVEVPAFIANATGVDFHEIYLSVSGDENWGENLLDENTYLPAGHILPVTLQLADADGITWDLSVADSEGNSIEWYELNIAEMPADGFAIELMWDGENGTAKLAATPDDLEGEYVTE